MGRRPFVFELTCVSSKRRAEEDERIESNERLCRGGRGGKKGKGPATFLAVGTATPVAFFFPAPPFSNAGLAFDLQTQLPLLDRSILPGVRRCALQQPFVPSPVVRLIDCTQRHAVRSVPNPDPIEPLQKALAIPVLPRHPRSDPAQLTDRICTNLTTAHSMHTHRNRRRTTRALGGGGLRSLFLWQNLRALLKQEHEPEQPQPKPIPTRTGGRRERRRTRSHGGGD